MHWSLDRFGLLYCCLQSLYTMNQLWRFVQERRNESGDLSRGNGIALAIAECSHTAIDFAFDCLLLPSTPVILCYHCTPMSFSLLLLQHSYERRIYRDRVHTMVLAAAATRGHRSAHSLATGPVMVEPARCIWEWELVDRNGQPHKDP